MASTETKADSGRAGSGGSAGSEADLAGLGAGLDALETPSDARTPLGRLLREKALPPVLAVALVLVVWQLAYHFEVKPHYQLPSPADVGRALRDKWLDG